MTRSGVPGFGSRVTAACPFCDAKYRTPWKKLYTAMTCQKCGQEFILTQPDEPPLTPSDPLAGGKPAAAAAVDTAPAPAAPTAPAPTISAAARPGDAPLVMALVAAALVGAAALATLVPYGRIAATALASVGLLVAGMSLLGLEKRVWVGWAAAGLNALILAMVLALPDWLGLTGWTPLADPEQAPKPVTAVGRDGSLPRPADWVDASAAVWQQGDVRVAVTSVSLGPVNLKAKDPAQRRELCLRVGLSVSNVGVARAIDIDGWDAPPKAPVLTADGEAVALRAGGVEAAGKVFPGKSADGTLTFAPPPATAQELRLEIPAEAVGGTDPVRLRIPRSMVGR